MAEHTPGPWRACWNTEGDAWVDRADQSELGEIAEVMAFDGYNVRQAIAEQRANANLIAAAPDLYEACKLALALYADARRFIPSMGMVGEEHHRISEVEAAIAKAEGREVT